MKVGWVETTLGDLCEIVSGATPKTGNSAFWSGGIPWATPKDLSNLDGAFIDSTPRTLSAEGLASCGSTLLPAGSVLLSSRAPIGHVAINTLPMATNQGFKSLVPRNGVIDSKYLFWWLLWQRPRIEAMGNGATFKEISKRTTAAIDIELPPIGEQRRIVAVLDAADAVRAKRRQAIVKLDTLTQAIFIDMFGDPLSGAQWVVRSLGEVVRSDTSVTYGIVQAGPEDSDGVPYIRTGDIKAGRIVESGLRRTSPEIADRFPRSRVETGEIVMSIRATVGTTAIVEENLHGANLTQGTARISPGDDVTSEFLLALLRSGPIQHWIERQVKGATFREITLTRLRDLPVALPPLSLQHEFASRCRGVERVRREAAQTCHEIDTLFTSLQQRAFRGEL